MNIIKARLFALTVLLVVALGFGCSSAPQEPRLVTVEIKDMKFVPDTVTVNKGDTIMWINKDMVAHDVTEESSGAWRSGRLESGASWKLAVPGEANYFCSIHRVMKGKIELE
jgi:plastocyanin